MAERKNASAMLPLIIVGACIFGVGIFQSVRPKAPEVNTGFVATPEKSTGVSGNPRTMQAPDAPAVTKDAAQRAAESDTTTKLDVQVNGAEVTLTTTNAPWLQGIMAGAMGNFREGVLGSLKAEQIKGDTNCAPVLTDMAQSALSSVEKVTCTAKDGAQIVGEFDERGDGELNVEYPNGGMVNVRKNDGDFNVETQNSQK